MDWGRCSGSHRHMLEVLMVRLCHRMRILTNRMHRCFKGWKLACTIVLLNVVLTARAEFSCIICLLWLNLGLTCKEMVLIITLFLSLFYDQHWTSCTIISKYRLSSLALLCLTNRYLFLHLYLKKMTVRFAFSLLYLLCRFTNNWLLFVFIISIKTFCPSTCMLHFSFTKGHVAQVGIVSSMMSFNS